METKTNTTGARRRQYSKEFKQDAVAIVLGPPRRPLELVGRELGINGRTLHKWVKQALIDSGQRTGVSSSELEESSRLRSEIARLERERDLLKRMIAFWVRETTV